MKTKRIQLKDLRPGMKIKTYTHDKGVHFEEVTDVWTTKVPQEDQRVVTYANGTTLQCSSNHPTMVSRGEVLEQVYPDDLSCDDVIITDAGDTRAVACSHDQRSEDYIDITVANTHTFFASNNEDGEMVLTHNSQGGVRNASATVTYPVWHYDFEDLIVLKNNQGTEETRARHLDYSVVTCAYLWRRFKNRQDMTLFDPNEVPDLYEAYYQDQQEFIRLYELYEQDPTKTKKVISAVDVFRTLLNERSDTGRIYLVFIDNVINQGPVDSKQYPIYQSNLCQEVLLPTRPFQNLHDPDGLIALCTLGSINWGRYKNPTELRSACHLMVRGLSNLLNYQDFLSVQSAMSNQHLRPLGVGVTNLAYWHAKRGLTYGSPEALAEVKRWMEHQAFYLVEASVQLAKERGACMLSPLTSYGQGSFPWEHRAPGVDELTSFEPSSSLDWESLRAEMIKHGVHNGLLLAIAPVESSSVVIDSTNGIEMPKDLVSVKESKASSLVQVVPGYDKLKDKYQLMWDQPDCVEYLKTAAVMAAYVDQSISTNTFYNPAHFPERKIPATLVAKNIMLAQKWGIKTLYYSLIKKTGASIDTTSMDAAEATSDVSEVVENTDDGEFCEGCVL